MGGPTDGKSMPVRMGDETEGGTGLDVRARGSQGSLVKSGVSSSDPWVARGGVVGEQLELEGGHGL